MEQMKNADFGNSNDVLMGLVVVLSLNDLLLIEEEVPCIIASSSTTQERADAMSSNEKEIGFLRHRVFPLTGN